MNLAWHKAKSVDAIVSMVQGQTPGAPIEN